MATANENLFDFSVVRSIGLHRYGTGQVSKILALLRRVEIQINSELQRADVGEKRLERLTSVLSKIKATIKDGNALIQKRLVEDFGDLAQQESEWVGDSVNASTPLNFDVISPNTDTLINLIDDKPFEGAYLSQWVDAFTNGQFERIRNAIQAGVASGSTTPEIVRALEGSNAARGRDGVYAQGRRSIETMVRTAITHVSTSAREEWYQSNSEIIKGIRWVSTLDARTSAVCRGRDGKIYPAGEGPRPPAHPNCRSTTVPILKSFRELGLNVDDFPEGTRASMNGQVPEALTYSQWLKKQPADVQNEILGGSTRGKLFRAGEMSLERFTDTTGKSYTLAELRQRDADAFRRAGLF